MRVLFYTGRNSNNKSGLSLKIWKIGITRNTVIKRWGAIRVEKRKLIPTYLKEAKIKFRSRFFAEAYVKSQVKNKLSKGYELKPRRRS